MTTMCRCPAHTWIERCTPELRQQKYPEIRHFCNPHERRVCANVDCYPQDGLAASVEYNGGHTGHTRRCLVVQMTAIRFSILISLFISVGIAWASPTPPRTLYGESAWQHTPQDGQDLNNGSKRAMWQWRWMAASQLFHWQCFHVRMEKARLPMPS
ncbi:hypothetical protein Micbo1qcDRAFT_211989 [Microdochium bolleyi]|uniref:Uncharacterized protein n=1 Tax=Microdochium bolleyi TaxID=196109 RepID=A0A136JKQ1_9PEZI|nr:hypothetical protein Micbo1qcDRAFT_211989 [Microdochium bolleyi]